MDDPGRDQAGLLEAFGRVLADYEFEHLLLAHGLPLVGNGRAELEQLVAGTAPPRRRVLAAQNVRTILPSLPPAAKWS